ncbi:MAG: toprim domain-containing protein [Polyangiaceae bacterium]
MSDYPHPAEIAALLAQCSGVAASKDVAEMLVSRGLDPEFVDDLALAWALPKDANVPRWASYQRQPWTDTGHRLLLPVYDADGVRRSVRAWHIANEEPKRLPPSGRRAGGLVLACPMGVAILSGANDGFPVPLEVVVAEGEPDFLSWATRSSDANESPVVAFGIGSGFWTAEHGKRVPTGTTVILRTDSNPAGDRYARSVAETLEGRCLLLRQNPVAA